MPRSCPDIVAGIAPGWPGGSFNSGSKKNRERTGQKKPAVRLARNKPRSKQRLGLGKTMLWLGLCYQQRRGSVSMRGFAGSGPRTGGAVRRRVSDIYCLMWVRGSSRGVACPRNTRFRWRLLDGNLMIVGIGIFVLLDVERGRAGLPPVLTPGALVMR